MRTPARSHLGTRRPGAPPLAALLVILAFLAALAMPATGLGASIQAYVGGDRTANDTITGFTSTVTPVTFEYRPNTAGSSWSDLCTVTGTATSCTSSTPNNNTAYVVRVKGTSVPAGWRAIEQISFGGGNAEAGPTLPYDSLVTTGNNNTVVATPNRTTTGTTTNAVTRFHMLARNNPSLPRACTAFNVVMTMDISSSINTAGGGYTGLQKRQGMAAGAKALIDGLAGAPVTLRLDTFGSAVIPGLTTYNLSIAADRTAAKARIDAVYQPTTANPSWPTNYTNWDSALTTARNVADPAVVVLLTDGNPTRDAEGVQDATVRQRAVSYAIASANSVKGSNKRIIAVGAGAGVTTVNLAAVSGPVADSDYFAGDFDELQIQLEAIAAQLCGAKVSVRKFVDQQSTTPAADWAFSATPANPGDGLTITGTNGGVTAGTPAETVFSIGNLPGTGTRTVRIDETLQGGYTFGNAQCREGSYPSYADVAGLASSTRIQPLALARESEWYCTYVNTRDIGTLQITKNVTGDVPSGLTRTFTFDITCTKPGEPNITDTRTINYPTNTTATRTIPTGYQCTVTEQAPTAVPDHTWGTPTITPATATITTKNQTYNIAVTNPLTRDTGTLEVVKHLSPADDPGRFNLTATGPTPLSATNIGHQGTTGTGGTTVNTGTYTITETAGTGTDLNDYAADITCYARDDADRTPINTGTDVDVATGADVICVIMNTRGAADVTVTKVVVGHGAGDTTTFPMSLTGEPAFALGHGETDRFTVASRRPMTLTEGALPAGYDFESIACEVEGTPVGTVDDRSITFTPDTGRTVECTVTNLRLPTLTVTKQLTGADAAGDTTAFPFTVSGRPGFTLAGGESTTGTLPVGSYTVAEGDIPAGYTFVAASCVNGSQTLGTGRSIDVALAAGDTVVCVFTNERLPAPPTPPVTPPAPPVTPPAPPVAPPAPPVAPPSGEVAGTPDVTPTLAITKTGPARARGLQRITYTIRVRNTGRVTARSVVVTDRLPRDLVFLRTSRKHVFRSGVIRISLGNMAPRQVKVVRIVVRAPANARGARVNVAQVRAADVRPRTARAKTVFAPVRRVVVPGVTG